MAENFGIGGMGLNPLSSMLDSVEMVKRAWSSFNLPAGMAPTLDPEELERRIKDLRTVEQWLTVNLGMLQSTIQALEAQRSAIVAMQAFGDAMKPSGPKPAESPKPAPDPRPDAEPTPAAASAAEALASAAAAVNPAGWWQMLRTQFEQVANAALGASAMAGHDQPGSPQQRPGADPATRPGSTGRKRSTRTGTPRRKPSTNG